MLLAIILNKKNFFIFILYAEVIYQSIMVGFLFIGKEYVNISSYIYFLVILTVVASETVIGLMLLILYYRATLNISINNLTILNG
jgi:NADH:ubiquinone oxidoreductase subunit K